MHGTVTNHFTDMCSSTVFCITFIISFDLVFDELKARHKILTFILHLLPSTLTLRKLWIDKDAYTNFPTSLEVLINPKLSYY